MLGAALPDFPFYLRFPRRACPGPRPGQDAPELGWGCVHPARRGEAALLPTHPSSSSSPLAGPHLPRGAPGSGRPWPPQQLPGLWPHPLPPRRPAAPPPRCRSQAPPLLCTGQSRVAVHGGIQSELESPAGPAPGAAASFGQRCRQGGWGRDAVVGVPGREDTPSPNSPQGWRTGAPLGEVGKLNTVPPTHSGVKFPATGGNQGLERE